MPPARPPPPGQQDGGAGRAPGWAGAGGQAAGGVALLGIGADLGLDVAQHGGADGGARQLQADEAGVGLGQRQQPLPGPGRDRVVREVGAGGGPRRAGACGRMARADNPLRCQ